jgi:cellulose synthase/poly-beta-1,6-N-acetylglucosamine synthase-like glycosyltransferase
MYLAEDRILCFEIVTKSHENWVYVFAMHVFDGI